MKAFILEDMTSAKGDLKRIRVYGNLKTLTEQAGYSRQYQTIRRGLMAKGMKVIGQYIIYSSTLIRGIRRT